MSFQPMRQRQLGELHETNRPTAFGNQPEPFVEPDWSGIAELLGETEGEDFHEDVQEASARALIGVLRLCAFTSKGCPQKVQAIGVRVLAIMHAFGVADGLSLEALGAPSGLSRQAIDAAAKEFRERFGTFNRAAKNEAARLAYRDSARAVHRRRKEGLLG